MHPPGKWNPDPGTEYFACEVSWGSTWVERKNRPFGDLNFFMLISRLIACLCSPQLQALAIFRPPFPRWGARRCVCFVGQNWCCDWRFPEQLWPSECRQQHEKYRIIINYRNIVADGDTIFLLSKIQHNGTSENPCSNQIQKGNIFRIFHCRVECALGIPWRCWWWVCQVNSCWPTSVQWITKRRREKGREIEREGESLDIPLGVVWWTRVTHLKALFLYSNHRSSSGSGWHRVMVERLWLVVIRCLKAQGRLDTDWPFAYYGGYRNWKNKPQGCVLSHKLD